MIAFGDNLKPVCGCLCHPGSAPSSVIFSSDPPPRVIDWVNLGPNWRFVMAPCCRHNIRSHINIVIIVQDKLTSIICNDDVVMTIMTMILMILLGTVFMVLLSWQNHCIWAHLVYSLHLINVQEYQADADSLRPSQPTGCESACRLLSSTSTIATWWQPVGW